MYYLTDGYKTAEMNYGGWYCWAGCKISGKNCSTIDCWPNYRTTAAKNCSPRCWNDGCCLNYFSPSDSNCENSNSSRNSLNWTASTNYSCFPRLFSWPTPHRVRQILRRISPRSLPEANAYGIFYDPWQPPFFPDSLNARYDVSKGSGLQDLSLLSSF